MTPSAAAVLLHAGHTTAPPLATRIAIAALAGFLAMLAAGVPMDRLDEGTTPPSVAGSVLYGKPPGDLLGSEVKSTYYTAGLLAGGLFGLLAAAVDAVGPPVAVLPGGSGLLSHLLAGVGVFGLLYVGFGYVVLPRLGREKVDVADRVRRHWAISAAVYVLALLAFVPAVTALLY
jgi:hypothetical protein